MTYTAALLLAPIVSAFTTSSSADVCPGSASYIHASCKLQLDVHSSCQDFSDEVVARMNGERGWTDPHNGGTYTVLERGSDVIQGQRLTGNKKYTDKFTFSLTSTSDGCQVTACSESQVFSVLDYSTNYCNLHVLYCGQEDNCAHVHRQLDYKETLSSCSQHDASQCIATPSASLLVEQLPSDEPTQSQETPLGSSTMCTLYKIEGAECGQSTLDCKFATAAKSFAGLKDGECSSLGYTKQVGTQTLSVPFITTVTVVKFEKESISTESSTMPALALTASNDCPTVSTQADFDLGQYVQGRWYIQEQAVTQYLPVEQNFCVYADYSILKKKSFWGYSIQVHNHAEEQDGTIHDSGTFLCAKQADKNDAAKLEVAPCFLPPLAAGPYWVIAYDEALGFALISGGQPTEKTANGCKTGSGVNDAGLWIFTREPQPEVALVDHVRQLATEQGFDVSVLNPVSHEKCNYD